MLRPSCGVSRRTTAPVLAAALLLAAAAPLGAQIATGQFYGVVTDESGAVLPGVAVTLEGKAGSRSIGP